MENTNIDVNALFSKIAELATTYGLQLLLAILVLVVGLIVIRSITKWSVKMMNKSNVDASLVPFLRSLISITLKVLLIISILSMVGIQMTSFIAVLGAAGLAVGLALQGTLQNFAGGVIILLFKPYKVGDYITTQGYSGTVKEIQIFTTVLNTPDNQTIIIPNSPIAVNPLTNYSTQETRRVDFTFGIGYNDDIDKARSVIMKIINEDARIHKEPEPLVKIANLGDSSVDFATRVWVNSGDYWNVFFDTNEKIKKAFDSEGISIPFPQQDVHLYKHE
ncbi:MAG: mechanosensitive ion channel domain-containing protein [Bacteroidales bacterium]|jgi:small conductance mechanosensitive channel|nr:mechanosensitive ion channel domain-containing protein [Bacteroidales bacterium]